MFTVFRRFTVLFISFVVSFMLLPVTVIAENTTAEYLITDKNVTITANQEVKGTASYPMYIAKRKIV